MRARQFLTTCICILYLITPLPLFSAPFGIFIHHLPTETTPTTFDEVPIWDASGYATKKLLLSNLVTYRSIAPSTDAQSLLSMTFEEMLTALGGTTTITDLDALPGDTVDDNLIDAALIATLNQATTGSAGSLKSTATTGLMSITGPGAGTTRVKTLRDANDTILELGGSYTPTGTWDWSSATLTFGTLSPTTFNLPSSNADPADTSGQLRHDSTVTGLTGGALKYYNGAAAKTIADYDSSSLTDGYFLKYSSADGGLVLAEATAVNSLDDLTDVVLTSAQQGDILLRGESNWVNLHNGISGQFLRTNGDGANPSWATPAGGGDMSSSSYPDLVAIEALVHTTSGIIVSTGSAWEVQSDATARTSLGAAASGANSDITSLTGLTTALATTMGGTGVKNNAASTITISGAYPLTVTLSNTTGVTFPTSGTLATTAQIPTASSLHLDDALTAVGLTSGYTSMGVVFTGSTITDTTSTVVSALQELETATESASTPSLDIIGDMAADGSIGMTGYKLTLASTLNAAGANITMTNTTADLTSDVSFLDLKYTDNGDANGFYLRGYDNSGGDLQWSIGQNGNISTAGTITSTATDSYLLLNNNSGGRAPTAASYEVYVDAGIWKTNQNGTEYCNVLSPTAGQVIFAGPTAARTVTLPDSDFTVAGLGTSNAFTGANDFGGATSIEIPNSDDTDVDAVGEISWDTDGWLRTWDGTYQVAIARKIEEIHVTVIKPNDLADAQRDAFLAWSNESGMTFHVTGWKGWSDTDNTTLNIETTAADGTTNATVDAVELATNGTGVYTGADTTITAESIADGSLIWLDFDDTDDPGYVKLTIYGFYNGNVN